MTKKLTLSLDDNIIENAKKYAIDNHTSVSKLVEFYFKSMSQLQKSDSYHGLFAIVFGVFYLFTILRK